MISDESSFSGYPYSTRLKEEVLDGVIVLPGLASSINLYYLGSRGFVATGKASTVDDTLMLPEYRIITSTM